MLYVGGLDESVTEELLYAAFIPFGELRSVNIPKDFTQNKSKGFGFVEYDLAEDAADAIENMDGSELNGHTLKCNIAKGTTQVENGKAIWTAEEWIKNNLNDIEKYEGQNDNSIESLVPTSN